MQFSVLMSVYHKDKSQWLKQAIDSVLNNTVKPDEIVVAVDGLIGDDLKNILQEYERNIPNFRNVFLPENKGRGEALNKVLPMCKYDLVALMDADDINLPTRFEFLLREFEKDKDLSIVGGYIQEFKDINKMLSIKKVPVTNEEIYKYMKFRSPINQPTVMFKKNDILRIGGYEELYLMEDYLLWIKAVENKLKLYNVPEVLVNMRINENLYIRRSGYKYFKSNKNIFDRLFKSGSINIFTYLFNVTTRFIVQVLMPNNIRALFYKKVLR